MNTLSHEGKALDHVAAVQAAASALSELYAQGYPDRAAIGRLNASIGRGLALAKVHATLAVAEALNAGNLPLDEPAITFGDAARCASSHDGHPCGVCDPEGEQGDTGMVRFLSGERFHVDRDSV